MIKLTRLTVNRYRHVRPGTSLRFRHGLHVLVGRNGSGKSTLLNLVSAALSMDFSPLREEPFDLAYEAEFDGDEIEAHVTSTAKAGAEGAENAADPFERTLDLKVRSAVDGSRLRVQVAQNQMTLVRDGQTLYEGPAAFDASRRPGMGALLELVRQIAGGQGLDQAKTLLSAARLARARRYDEALGFFHAMLGEQAEIYLMPTGSSLTAVSFVTPDEVTRPVLEHAAAGRREPLHLSAQELPFLAQVRDRCGFTHAEAVIEVASDEADGKHWGRPRFIFTRPSGGRLDQSVLTFGQKRLLSFLYYAASSPYLALVDELPNGLDREWTATCVRAIEGRQSFLASQGPLLFEHLRLDNGEDVRRTIVVCESVVRDGHEEMVWEQLPEKAANAFYRSWKAGPQEFAESLRTKGWW